MVVCGYERNRAEASWEFSAGGGGGISLRLIQPSLSLGDEPNDATESLKAMITPVVRLLGDKELETLDVVGDLFSSLLLTYMNARKHGTAAVIDLNAKEGSTASEIACGESTKIPISA